MASIEQWADRLSKIRRGLDPDQPEMDPNWQKQLDTLDLIRKGGQPSMRDGVSERQVYQDDAEKSYAPGTPEEAIARTLPQDNSVGGKIAHLLKVAQQMINGEAPEQQGLHDYQKEVPARVYAKGGLGKVQSGIDKGVGFLQNIMYGGDQAGPVTGRDYDVISRGPQENRGTGNILQNLALVGSRRRLGNKELREGEEERQANLELKRAQAAYQRSGVGYREGQLDVRREANEIARIRAEVYSAKSSADIDRLERQLKVNQQNSLTRMDEARTAARNARSTEERDAANEEYRQAKFIYDKAQDLIDNDIRQKQLEVSKGNLDVSRGNLNISQQKLPGELAQQNAGLNKTVAEAAQIGPSQQRLLDALKEAKKENARKDIMDRYRFGFLEQEEAQKQLDALDKQDGGFTMPSFDVPYDKPLPSPDVYEGDSSYSQPRSRSSQGPAKRTDNESVTFINTDGEELVLTPAEAKRVMTLIKSGQMRGWSRKQ